MDRSWMAGSVTTSCMSIRLQLSGTYCTGQHPARPIRPDKIMNGIGRQRTLFEANGPTDIRTDSVLGKRIAAMWR